jgi:PKD repeat protein
MKRILPPIIGLLLLLFLPAQQVHAQYANHCAGMADFEFKVDCNTLIAWGKMSSKRTCPSYTWDFGNNTSQAQGLQVSHKFARAGKYTVCLRVKDTCLGCDTVICKEIEIKDCNQTVCQLKPDFSFKLNCRKVQFEASSNLNSTSFSWNFGDGSSSNLKAPNHTYLKDGEYTVCVTATWVDPNTNKVCKEIICKKVVIRCNTQPCNLTGSFNFKVNANGIVGFEAKSNGGVRYVWDFGNGHTGSGQQSRTAYLRPGVYKVCVTIYGKDPRCVIRICREVVIGKPCHLSGGFKFQLFSGTPGKVGFNAYSNQKNATYTWSFGDGTSATGANPYKVYSKGGTYEVCLTIRFQHCEQRICRKVVIPPMNNTSCNKPENWGFVVDRNNCLRLTFEAPLKNCVKYKWAIDGQYFYNRVVTYTFTGGGSKQICLYVQDTCNRCDTMICKTITVNPCNNSCHFPNTTGFTYSIKCDTVVFEGSQHNCGKYYWNLGNGTTASGRVIKVPYVTNKSYTVCMKIVDTCGNCDTTVCETIQIPQCTPCQISADFSIDSIVKGKIYLKNKSSSNAVWQEWDFGDKSGSTDKNPVHSYSAVGTYTICLTVWNQAKTCSAMVCKNITISSLRRNATSVSGSIINSPQVYPNPASSYFRVEWPYSGEERRVVLTDLNGRELFEIVPREAEMKTDIPVQELPEGIYLVRLTHQGQTTVHRVAVNR